MKGGFSNSFIEAYSMRELNSPITTFECERGYHRNLSEYEKNSASKVANLAVKRPFGNEKEQ